MNVNVSTSVRVAAALLVCALTCLQARAQESRLRVVRPAPVEAGRQSPVEVVSVRVKGAAVEAGRHFPAGDDWLRGLTLKLKNVSDRPVSYVDISLHFPTVAGRENKMLQVTGPVAYGCFPGFPCRTDVSGSHAEILPGETREVELSEARYQGLIAALARTGAATPVESLEYGIDSVLFDPDTKWSRGFLFRRDPSDPSTYRMSDKYVLPKRPAL
jgi:hypothetical protein